MASRSHGVVTRGALLVAGVSPEAIRQRQLAGSLIPVHRGVYRVGHAAPSVEARYMAAVLACGERAVLSHLAAAWLYRLIRGAAPPPEVTAPTDRRVPGIGTHRGKIIRRSDLRGIPIATVPDTLTAIATRLQEDELGRAAHEARVLYGTKAQSVPKPWPAPLKRILEGDVRITLSKLERRFLEILRAHGLPLPQTNRNVDGHYVDCRWPDHRLTVELDGYAAHDSRYAWRQDHLRERAAYKRGDEYRRYSYEDVLIDPADMLRELVSLLPPPRARAPRSLPRS